MNNAPTSIPLAAVLILCLGFAAPAVHAKESSVKEGAKDVGHAFGSAVRQVGQGGKKVGKAIGGAAKEGVGAVKEGGREFKRAVKGEK